MRKFLFSFFLILLSTFSFSQEIFAAVIDDDKVINCTANYLPPYPESPLSSATTCPAGTTRQAKICSSLNKTLICKLDPTKNNNKVEYCCSIYPSATQTENQQYLYNKCIVCSRTFATNPGADKDCGTVEKVVAQCAAYTAAATAEWEGAQANDPCTAIKEASSTCRYCMYGDKYPAEDSDVIGFWTGIGCISTNPMGAISQLTTFLLGVVGVFIFFQILIGAFTLLTSKGSPQAVQSARERITNSIIALLLIIFSVTILQFVGVNVLHIPGFFDN